MSQYQVRGEKKDLQYRKTGVVGGSRHNNSPGLQQRQLSSGTGNGTASPVSSAPSSTRSFKKTYNVQVVQSRGNSGPVNTSPDPNPVNGSSRPVENGGHVQSAASGLSDKPTACLKPADTSIEKSNQFVPKVANSQSSSLTSDSALPAITSKGDASKGFSLQFGSINPGLMSVKQLPARTNSAPPTMDEQQSDQACHAASNVAPEIPVPAASKQQMAESVMSTERQNSQGTLTVSKATNDVQMMSVPSPLHAQKPSVPPVAGISMPVKYPQLTVPMQFGGPSPQIRPQGMPVNSVQRPLMPLHMGSPPQVQQPIFVPGLQHQHHLMPNQAIIHQGQNFGFNPQLGHQLPHQLGNFGMSIPPQFDHQQAGKVGNARKTIKITHPETHEELRLDDEDGGSPGSRSKHLGNSQPAPDHTVTRSSGFYTNAYTTASPYYPTPNSLPLTSCSQAPRFNHPSQVPQTLPFVTGPLEASTLDLARSANHVLHSLHPLAVSTSVTVKATVGSTGERGNFKAIEKCEKNYLSRPVMEANVSGRIINLDKNGSPLLSKSSPESSGHSDINAPSLTSIDVKKESLNNSDLIRGSQVQVGQPRHLQNSSQVSKVSMPESAEVEVISDPLRSEVGVLAVVHDSPSSVDAAQSAAPAVDLGIENKIGEDTRTTESDCLMQCVTGQQGETKCSRGLQPRSTSKAMHGVNETSRPDEFKYFDPESSQTDAPITSAACDTSNSASSVSKSDTISCKDIFVDESVLSDAKRIPVSSNFSKADVGQEVQIIESSRPTSSSGTLSGSSKTSGDANRMKNNRGKKKRKEMFQKAEALGTTTDLYMAYKGQDESKENAAAEVCATDHYIKDGSASARLISSPMKKKEELRKLELEDWEDVADASTPKLELSDKGKHRGLQDDNEALVKKYSRDFLLTISAQCTRLPEGIEITSDIAGLLMQYNTNISHDSPGLGRMDRPGGAARVDRHGYGVMDTDRWGKPTNHHSSRDPNTDLAYISSMMGFQPGHGANHGVLKPRGQGSFQQGSGFLPGMMHSVNFQGIQQKNPDGDRWQRATNFNKGLMGSPQTHLQAIHRAEKKYEVGKVSDEEQAKQRRLKAILNKLTPQNFDKLFEQVEELKIDNVVTLTGVISQIFDKALMEPTFCEMYANFCYHLASELPDLSVDNQKITFRRLLLNKCQEEFERGEREEEEANKEEEGENKQSDQTREEKRLQVRRRMLGNIRLIGELYKKKMLTERIMHECIKKLLGQYQNVDEENIEALCKLMSTIGEMIDHPKAKEHMDAYFDIMWHLSNNMKLSSRVRFMLKDTIDLRKNRWQQRRKVEGPKKIEEVHKDAAQERVGHPGRLTRGSNMNSAIRRGQPLEYAPRVSTAPSPAGQPGGYRGSGTQFRGYGGQDARIDDKSGHENMTCSVPLLQRSSGDKPIMLGPQGGLARGMSCRGNPSAPSAVTADNSSSHDARRATGGLNGVILDRTAHSSRGDQRFSVPVAYDQSRSQEVDSIYMNKDLRNSDGSMDRCMLISPLAAPTNGTPSPSVSTEKVYSEERLRGMSIAAIKEYYSAKDEKEVELCIKDLNAPSFYPTVISIWVSDAFERKDLEREMLTKLLVYLTKPRESSFSPQQLIEGFESVLTAFEDTVADAPRAPEFLGRMLGNLVVEEVIPMQEVGSLLHRGGEEPGRLLEVGLAADVLGCILEMIKSDKGESTLNEVRRSSDLRLEDYMPPPPLRSRRLEMFMYRGMGDG